MGEQGETLNKVTTMVSDVVAEVYSQALLDLDALDWQLSSSRGDVLGVAEALCPAPLLYGGNPAARSDFYLGGCDLPALDPDGNAPITALHEWAALQLARLRVQAICEQWRDAYHCLVMGNEVSPHQAATIRRQVESILASRPRYAAMLVESGHQVSDII